MFINATYKMMWVCALILMIWPGLTVAKGQEAGIVIIASGDVVAHKMDDTDRPLKRRSRIYTGEIIVVGEHSKAQLRFLDGTILSLKSGTELRIDAFSYGEEAGREDVNIVTLIKGGFRTITGAVAKKKPANHKVNTPVATIGVRGTNYSVAIGGSVYVGVWDGVVFVENDGGEIELGGSRAYSYAEITNAGTAPEGLLEPPQILVETVAVDQGGDVVSGDEIAIATAPASSGQDFTSLTDASSEPTTDNLYEAITAEQTLTTAPADLRLSDTEKSNLDSIGVVSTVVGGGVFVGNATTDVNGNPVVVNRVIDNSTGFPDIVIRKGNAVDAGAVTNIAVGTKQVNWGVWDATVAGNEAMVQTDPSDPTVANYIQDRIYWLTAQPTDATVLSGISTTGTWAGTIVAGNFDGMADNSQAVTSMNFDSTVNFASGAITNTALQASTATDFWDIQFQDGALNGAGFDLAVDSATSTLNRSPSPTEAVTGDLHGVVTGDNAEGIAAQFTLESSGTLGARLDGRFVSSCATCP